MVVFSPPPGFICIICRAHSPHMIEPICHRDDASEDSIIESCRRIPLFFGRFLSAHPPIRRKGGISLSNHVPLCRLQYFLRPHQFQIEIVSFQGGEDEPAQAPAEAMSDSVVLTPPLSLLGGLAAELQPPNLVQRIIGLFKNVRPGTDLTDFPLPAVFNMPKSQLQCYGETVYCAQEDLLSRCARGNSSLERFVSVVAWSISTTRPPLFGLAPYNPVLGETHHVSRGNLHVILEQVSVRPPVSALHATDEEEGVELLWCQKLATKFIGTAIENQISGKRELKLRSFGESYEVDSPSLVIRFLPTPSTDWAGDVRIICRESGLEAELSYHRSSGFFGFGSNPRAVKGRIFHSKTQATIYEIYGQWDKTVMLKDVHSGSVRVLYDAEAIISQLKTPIVRDQSAVASTESAAVWAKVNVEILRGDWDMADELKRAVEQRVGNLAASEDATEKYTPQFFHVDVADDASWSCSPKLPAVPLAPIVVDF